MEQEIGVEQLCLRHCLFYANGVDSFCIPGVYIYNNHISGDEKIPGFGHRYHTTDPRAEKLIQIAIKEGFVGPHIKLAVAIEDLLSQNKGIKLNVDGANAAILSDLGFTPDLGLGIFIIGRVPGIIAHIHEEKMDEDEFRRFCDLDDIIYGGH